MGGLIRVILAVLLLLAAAGVPAPALAQHPRVEAFAPGVEFEPLTPTEAYHKAKQQKRLLFIYQYTPRQGASGPFEKMWRNPTLALYLKWHAVVIKHPVPGLEGVLIIKDEWIYARLGAVIEQVHPGREGPRLLRAYADKDLAMPRLAGAAGMLMRLDFVMDRIRAFDPAWAILHDQLNPPPEPPPMPPPFYLSDDGLGDPIEDTIEEPAGVWDTLDAARRAAEIGNLHYATGLYTWLWERGEEVDPAFGPARRSFLAAEIAEVARRRPGARERFGNIRDARARRLLWGGYDDYHEWCVLSSIVGDDDLIVEWFDYFINDEQEAAMIPRADREAYDVLLARTRFADPWELGPDPVGRVLRIERMKRAPRPPTIPHDDWDRLQAFLGEHLRHEACRLHAACLRAGRADDAQRIASALLRVEDTAEARYAIITTALAAGVAGEMHTRFLGGAEARGGGRVDLRERLEGALKK